MLRLSESAGLRPAVLRVLVVTLVILSQPARAQTPRVTDTELRAAYCLGVSTAQFERAAKEVQSKRQEIARGKREVADYLHVLVSEDVQKIIAERRDRLRDYLKAKGFLSGRSIKEIDIPLERGVKDARQCNTDANEVHYEHCRKTCGPLNTGADYERCDSKCPASEACIRVKRCLENFLPF